MVGLAGGVEYFVSLRVSASRFEAVDEPEEDETDSLNESVRDCVDLGRGHTRTSSARGRTEQEEKDVLT